MSKMTQLLDQWLYPDVDNNWDDKLFRDRILEHITAESVVLDLGAGAGIIADMNFRGLAGRVCGIDPDSRVLKNQFLDDARVGSGERIPFEDGSFDLVFADNVLEHLSHPESVLLEVNRVLKSGGLFLAKTPNTWHYMPVISRITPHSFHLLVNRVRGRAEVDTFPTRYRANSIACLRRLARRTGFVERSIEAVEGRPEYLRMTAITYVFGWLFEKFVNSSSLLARFRIVLLVALQKGGNAPARADDLRFQ